MLMFKTKMNNTLWIVLHVNALIYVGICLKLINLFFFEVGVKIVKWIIYL